MKDIELVIKIPEKYYNDICNSKAASDYSILYALDAIRNGTQLPKGHGVLKDVTNLMRGLYTDMQTIEETFMSSDVYRMIDEECPTIIEADKKENEELLSKVRREAY